MIREILTDPNPALLQVSHPVDLSIMPPPVLVALRDDMLDTMRASRGIGLAAIQIGLPLRVIIMEPKPGDLWFMINPEITRTGEVMKRRTEACLSVPGAEVMRERPDQIRVRFTDHYGKSRKVFAQGWFATCIQHEIDHLNGVLISSAAPTEGTHS